MSQAAPSSIDVLLVDDEPEFGRLVADQLGASGGDLSVTVETDAESAIDRLGVDTFDCVVSDYEMPGMDGLDLLETVRERDPDLPFILFTGQGSEGVASEAISAGVTEYMRKGTDPQQFDVLANRIRNAAEKYYTERQLERTETRYRRLVEQNLNGIYILRDDDVAYANPKCAEIFGYEQEELVGLSVWDLVAEEDHEKLRETRRRRERGGIEEQNYTLTGVRKGGETFEFEVHSGPIQYEGGPAVLGTLVDVTEQRERERELEEYRELVETVGDPMYVLDDDGCVEKVNAAMADLLGYEREELLGSSAETFVDQDGLERGQALVRSIVEGRTDPPQTIEIEFITALGSRVPVEANITVLTDEEGAFRGTVGVVRVIAERKARERELEEYETIVETAPDGVFIVDDEGVFVSGNELGASMVGYEREELIGNHYGTLVEAGVLDESFIERYVETVETLLDQDEGARKAKLETEIDPPDGRSLTTELHIAVLQDDEGDFRGTVGILRDITERKSIENALRAERDRLSALFENIPEPTIDYEFRDGQPVVLQANDAFEEVFDYEEAEMIGESVDEFIIPPEEYDQATDLNERVIAGEQLDVELKRVTADGETRDFLLRNAPIPADDTIQGYAIYTDITERKRTEERINALFEFSTDCIVETEYVDGRPVITRVNDAFLETFGYEESELVGSSLDDLLTGDAHSDDVETINERVVSGEPVETEVTRMTADGPRDFLLRAIPFDTYEGDWTYAVYTDITERNERERRLSALHEATRELMDATSQTDVLGIGLDAAESVLGLEVAAFYGLDRESEVIAPLSSTRGAEELFDSVPALDPGNSVAWEAYRTGEPIVTDDVREHEAVHNPDTPARSEMLLPVGDHGIFIAASEEVGAYDEADATLAKVLVSNVEAALNRAARESLLRERERRLSALHEATRRLMEATSRDDVVDIGLRAAESVLGLDVAAVYARDDDRLVPLAATDDATELFGGMPAFDRGESILWQVYDSGEPIVTDDFREQSVVYEPGTPVRSEMILPIGEHGVFMAASEEVGAFDDADETLAKVLASNVEAALDRAERESLLREREQALLRQNERLEEFAGVVSHDLRSPLTVAKGNVYLFRQKGEEAYLDKIETALERMERLIDDLLTLARQGETVDEVERADLAQVADDAWNSVETAAADLDVDPGPIHADPSRFQQLLENLFRNAVEHGGRSVNVAVGVEDDCLYVADDGEGVPEGERDQLFDAGFTTEESGSGFGLSIVKQIAEAHGWEVEVTEGEDGGARFEFHGVERPEAQTAD